MSFRARKKPAAGKQDRMSVALDVVDSLEDACVREAETPHAPKETIDEFFPQAASSASSFPTTAPVAPSATPAVSFVMSAKDVTHVADEGEFLMRMDGSNRALLEGYVSSAVQQLKAAWQQHQQQHQRQYPGNDRRRLEALYAEEDACVIRVIKAEDAYQSFLVEPFKRDVKVRRGY